MKKRSKVSRKKSVINRLREKYPGEWKYIPGSRIWVCEELKMSAFYVADGGYDVNGNYMPPLFKTPPRVYGNGVRGEHIW